MYCLSILANDLKEGDVLSILDTLFEKKETFISYGSPILNMFVNALANLATISGVNKKIVDKVFLFRILVGSFV
jgi:hypothetical protein